MKKQMEILNPDPVSVRNIQKQIGCHPVTAMILANRAITSKKAIAAFFHSSLQDIQSFENLIDMDKAVERITDAILNKEKILVFGDYDVDGITATTILYEFLLSTEAEVHYYIPHRIEEGYGLKTGQIEQTAIPDGFHLIITIDCGSASHEAVDYANQAGIDIIVTDHHSIEASMPKALAVVNPKRQDCPSKAPYLAGVGVAFCLLIRLRKHLRDIEFWKNRPEPNLKNMCDLVALGTIADIVPMIQENRIMTRAGLEVINNSPRPGIEALIKLSGISNPVIDTEDVAFRLSPRLNAAGRMAHARMAVQLLHAASIEEALLLAADLDAMNAQRQEVEQQIFQNILMYFDETPEYLRPEAIVLGKKDWHEGVLGIVASKLVEKYYRPVVLISFRGKVGKGSARSIPGLNLYQALCQCAEYLEGFGGHPMAAGLSLKKENFKGFVKQFEKTIAHMIPNGRPTPSLRIDCRLEFDMISEQMINEISYLQPFGPNNPEPLFCSENVDVIFSKSLKNTHRKMTLKQRHSRSDIRIDGIWFHVEGENMYHTHFASIAFRLRWNHWNGKKNMQAMIVDASV